MTAAPRQGDVVAAIKAAVDSSLYDLTRAEGRADFDDALRAEIAKIEDSAVRAHAGEMIRQWRQDLFYPQILERERAYRAAEAAATEAERRT